MESECSHLHPTRFAWVKDQETSYALRSSMLSVLKLGVSPLKRKKNMLLFFQKYFKSITIILERPANLGILQHNGLQCSCGKVRMYVSFMSRGSGKSYIISKIRCSRQHCFHYAQMYNMRVEKNASNVSQHFRTPWPIRKEEFMVE